MRSKAMLEIDQYSFYFLVQSIIFYILSIIFSTLIISIGLVTSTQMTGYNEHNIRFPVNKTSCTCDCWDGFFRGIYGRGGYKIFYFNYEKQTIIILCILLFYSELLRKYLFNLIIEKRIILVVLIPSIYSNFYGIWSIINYINDGDYYRMLKSQIFFSLTELLSTYILYHWLIKKDNIRMPLSSIYFLLTISCLHIILAFGELNFDRFGRNFALVSSDFISLVYVIIMFRENNKLRPNMPTIYIWLFVALCLCLFYHFFCPFREKLK